MMKEKTYQLEHYPVLRELFHDRPGACEITLAEAASRYEEEEPRAALYAPDERERQFIMLCAATYPEKLLDRWLK